MAMFAIIYCGASLLSGCEGHYHDKAERARIAKLSELRKQVSSAFLLGAIGFVCIGLLGPTVTEASRKYVAEQFRLSISDQVFLAKALYWSGISVVLVFSLFNAHLKNVQPAVWLLLGATAYPFFVHVIPSLEAGDKMQRKAAVAQIKSFLMLIFIFYVILRFLSPDGFGNIQMR
jgi:Na+/phosphate symporter